MRVMPIVKKELRSYFNSPIAYVVAVAFLVFASVWFLSLNQFLFQNVASLRGYFSIVPLIYIVVVPALTMRIWAEERRLGTAEILFTLPYREWELVAGKFAAAFGLLLVIALLTIPLPLTLLPLGDFQKGQIVGEYLGMLFLGGAAIAVGQYISSLVVNQISAFLGAALSLVFLTLIGSVNAFMDLPAWLASAVSWISFRSHFESFDKGLLDSRDILYFLIVTGLFLYLTTKSLARGRFR